MPDERNTALPAILIPDFSADACTALASELISKGHYVIAACDAGNTADACAAQQAGCVVIETERGKALRAGFEYFLRELSWLPGVVTVDGAEGYSANDIVHVASAMEGNPGKVIVAARAACPGLGLRQRLVKACAGKFLSALHGRAVKDPWAGLRAIPAAVVPSLLDLKGEGRKFAFNIVLNLQHKGIKAISVPVSAGYEPGCGPEHSERAKDVLRILALPFTFIAASLSATACDYLIFSVTYYSLHLLWVYAQTAGRFSGAIVGYFLNKNIVFKNRNKSLRDELISAAQYIVLVLVNYGASIGIMALLIHGAHFYTFLAKFTTDVVLFVSNYLIQREIIFKRKMPIPN